MTNVRVDHVRHFGRSAANRAPDMAQLCGGCGTGKAAISPTGDVSPCVFSSWMSVGNVREAPLPAILNSTAMIEANASIRSAVSAGAGGPDDDNDDKDEECSPGFPGSGCNPRT